MSLSLYALTDELRRLREMLDNGEVTDSDDPGDEVEVLLDKALHELLPEKVAAYCGLIASLKREAEAFKAETARLADRRKAAEALAERLTDRLQAGLEMASIEKMKAGTFAVTIQASPPALVVEDGADAIPDRFFVEQAPKLNNAALKAALLAGEVIPGARLNRGHYLRIR